MEHITLDPIKEIEEKDSYYIFRFSMDRFYDMKTYTLDNKKNSCTFFIRRRKDDVFQSKLYNIELITMADFSMYNVNYLLKVNKQKVIDDLLIDNYVFIPHIYHGQLVIEAINNKLQRKEKIEKLKNNI